MRINKFNEKKNVDITFAKVDKLGKLETQMVKIKRQYKDLFREIAPAMTDYLYLHPELQEDPETEMQKDYMKIEVIRVVDRTEPYYYKYKDLPDDAYLEIVYWPDDDDGYDEENLKSAFMSKKDIEDFILQESAKKYNL